MKVPAIISNIVAPILRAVEGAFRPGPYQLPLTGGWLPNGAPSNWWQCGYDPWGGGFPRSAMVEACVSAYAQTVAMCPGDHWRLNNKGGRDRVKNSALSRILRHPNAYQSISDFLLNATRNLYVDGNTYALALRNDRFEVSELHLMDSRQSFPQVAVTGDVFYTLGGNDVISRQIGAGSVVVPQRDVLHIRLHTDRRRPHPLIGETPLAAAMADIGVGDAIAQQQIQFYMNQARPSAVLSTDAGLTRPQVDDLRALWDDQAKGLNQGGTPILTHGLKVQPWALQGKDSAIAEMAKLSQDRIALVYRVPLQVLGIQGATGLGSTEAIMQFWVATGLGFALNHIEEAFGLLFALKGQPEEYVEFDTGALLRSAWKDRIEALARGVQGGIFAPNEARNSEGYPDVKFGDEPRVQQQVVPLSAAAGIGAAGPKLPSAPPAPSPPSAPPADPAQPELPKDYRYDVQREARRVIAAAAKYRGRLG